MFTFNEIAEEEQWRRLQLTRLGIAEAGHGARPPQAQLH
jgi:hypothetical protein